MEEYHVNLGGDAVPNAERRRKRYHLMLLYFLFCGLLLAEGAYRVVGSVMQVNSVKAETRMIEEKFRAAYPHESSLKSYADSLKRELGGLNATLGALQKNLPEQVDAMALVHALMVESPKYTDLLTFSMSEADELVSWTVRVILVEDDEVSPEALVRKWRDSEMIGAYVEDVVMVDLDDSSFVKGVPALKISCRATVKAGK